MEATAKVAKSGRGSKPGERRGGRKPGVPNKATREIREIAREYVPAAMVELARLAENAESEAARVAAIKEVLDRAFGKSPQAITGSDGGALISTILIAGVAPSVQQ